MTTIQNHLRRAMQRLRRPSIYLIRCVAGTSLVAFTFRGALRELAMAPGGDAVILTLTGRWVAGRRLQGA